MPKELVLAPPPFMFTPHWPFYSWPRPQALVLKPCAVEVFRPEGRALTSRPVAATAASPYGRLGTYRRGSWLVGLCTGHVRNQWGRRREDRPR